MHTIRLRAAWEINDDRAIRRFNKPTGLDAGSRVYLAWDGPGADAQLNGVSLNQYEGCATAHYEVTHLLENANVLVIETGNSAVLSTVRLMIEEEGPQG